MALIEESGGSFTDNVLKERTVYSYNLVKSNVVVTGKNILQDDKINPRLKIDERAVREIAEKLIVNELGIFAKIPEERLLKILDKELTESLFDNNGTPQSESAKEMMGKVSKEAVSRMHTIVKGYNLGNQQSKGVGD